MLASAAIFIAAFVVYGSNGDEFVYSYDSLPNSLLVLNLIENHRLDFDNFRDSYVQRKMHAGYVFERTPDGRLQSIFPIGTAIVTAPVYVVLDAVAHAKGEPLDLTSPAFERRRLYFEKLAARVVGGLAAIAMFWCLREFVELPAALTLTVVFAFGTSMWSIGSLALWQHGSVNLVVLAMTYALLRAARAEGRSRSGWFAAAGAAAGFLPLVRPTAILFSLAAAAWVARTQRDGRRPFGIVGLIVLTAAPAWNLANFHSLAGGYAGDAASYDFAPAAVASAWAALAVSPSKGIVFYLPLIVPAAFGVWRAGRAADARLQLLAYLGGGALALALSYGFYLGWWGGYAFGPRFLTDLDAVAVLCLVPLVEPLAAGLRRHRPGAYGAAATAALLAAYSVGVQVAGANGEDAGRWSATPADVNAHPERVWDVRDPQIVRDARAAVRRLSSRP